MVIFFQCTCNQVLYCEAEACGTALLLKSMLAQKLEVSYLSVQVKLQPSPSPAEFSKVKFLPFNIEMHIWCSKYTAQIKIFNFIQFIVGLDLNWTCFEFQDEHDDSNPQQVEPGADDPNDQAAEEEANVPDALMHYRLQ